MSVSYLVSLNFTFLCIVIMYKHEACFVNLKKKKRSKLYFPMVTKMKSKCSMLSFYLDSVFLIYSCKNEIIASIQDVLNLFYKHL